MCARIQWTCCVVVVVVEVVDKISLPIFREGGFYANPGFCVCPERDANW